MSTILRGPKEDGQSVVLGVKMACSSSSIRLMRETEYNGGERTRPLSPVRLRTKLPADIKVEAPPTLVQLRRANEVKALESPFIRHKTRRERETWLLKLGSLRKAKDEMLQKELDLHSQLNKIISPIKTKRSARNLHKPKLRKMPEHVRNEILEEEYLKEKQMEEKLRQEQEQMYFYGGGVGMGMDGAMGNGDNTKASKSVKSVPSDSSQGAVVMTPISTTRLIESTDSHSMHSSHHSHSLHTGSGSQEPHDHEHEGLWSPFDDTGGGGGPYGEPINMMGGVVIHNPATPISCLSDISDRDVFSAGSHLSGGMYGDFEDDLVSAGGSNHDEHEYILEEKI